MRVKLTADYGPHRAGSEVDLPDEQARRLIASGSAHEIPEGRPGPARPEGQAEGVEETMILRFRHDHSVGGRTYLSGQKERVPVSDDAWKAVNEGHADLDPPPGEAVGDWVQPHPPEWVTRADVPLPRTPEPAPLRPATPGLSAKLPEPTEKVPEQPPGEQRQPPRRGR
jgi:hypothetical protein